ALRSRSDSSPHRSLQCWSQRSKPTSLSQWRRQPDDRHPAHPRARRPAAARTRARTRPRPALPARRDAQRDRGAHQRARARPRTACGHDQRRRGRARASGMTNVLVTGATDGLGKALAAELAGAGATVLLHGRDEERGERTLAELRARTGSKPLRWYRADLASLAEVRSLAEQVAADHARLDVLVNNAGIGSTAPGDGHRVESQDRDELRFAINSAEPFR